MNEIYKIKRAQPTITKYQFRDELNTKKIESFTNNNKIVFLFVLLLFGIIVWTTVNAYENKQIESYSNTNKILIENTFLKNEIALLKSSHHPICDEKEEKVW